MNFYDLSKAERSKKVADIQFELQEATKKNEIEVYLEHFGDEDIYLRKAAYLGIGRIYSARHDLRKAILAILTRLQTHRDELVRQTVVNTAGEIGMFQFEMVYQIFDRALFDDHHKVRNAVIGSVKKMSKKNPEPTLIWAKKYLKHPDKEVRREICHGIELRGRTHPEEILPLLKVLQNDDTARVRGTLVHVIGQISYKKNCLPKVVKALKTWKNMTLVHDAIDEIIDVHSEKRYAKFAELSQQHVIDYISEHLPNS